MNSQYRYIYGSTAPNLSPEPQKIETQRMVKKNPKPKVKSHASTIPSTGTITLILMVFVLCFTLIYRYALITEMNYKFDQSLQAYNNIKDSNLILMAEIEKSTDLNRIQEIAEKRLEMHKPDKYQVVCVSVPRSSFAEVASMDASEVVEYGFVKRFQKTIGVLTHMIIK